jgi:excisionase family DNA binding protein
LKREEAARLGIGSLSTLDKLVREGKLRTYRVGRGLFILRESVEEYIREQLAKQEGGANVSD